MSEAERSGEQRRGVGSALVQLLTGDVGALLALIAIVAFFAVADRVWGEGYFTTVRNLRVVITQTSVVAVAALGMTMVIITGGIDLSVGSVLALSAVCCSLATIYWGWPGWLAIPLCLAIGAACGGVSGTLAARFRIQPFIATLAMMVFARGLAKEISGGIKISTAVQNPDGTFRYVDLPGIFRAIDFWVLPKHPSVPSWLQDKVSVVTLIFLACVAVSWIALARHRWGRELYAIGGNEEAARLSGVSVGWSKTLAYVASGILAAVAGICYAAQDQQGDPEAGWGYELNAIAIVVIGGLLGSTLLDQIVTPALFYLFGRRIYERLGDVRDLPGSSAPLHLAEQFDRAQHRATPTPPTAPKD